MNTESGGCCIAVVFLHRPFYRALESRPPYVATRFSLEDWQTQSDAAVSFHYLHTLSLTFRGVNAGFETPKGITGTILPAFSVRAYVSWRLHYGDLRVGTLLAKALLLGERGNRVLDKPLMRLKTWNEFCRRHGEDAAYRAITFLDRLFFYISTSRDDEETIVNEVYSRLVRQNSNHQKYIDSDLKRLRDDYFKVSSHLMSAIIAKHDERPPAKKKPKNISNRYGNN